MLKHRTTFFLLLSFSAILFTSCKKNEDVMNENGGTSAPAGPAAGASVAQLNAAAVTASRDWYLWNTNIPATIDANQFADPAATMISLRQYGTETGFAAPVDRWSFAMKQAEWDAMSGGLSTVAATAAGAGDFGITVFFRAEGDLRVKSVEPASPAGTAGIRRGWRVTKINGSNNISTGNSQFIVDNVYYSAASTFSFTKPDGSAANLSLSAAHYAIKPMLMDTVYNTNSGKAGYFVYSSFLGDINQSKAEYARVFSKFAANGVNQLIVDLRYNGGGYVSLQENLANYIINSSSNGQMMMKQIYNNNHAAENITTTFHKAGALNLTRVYFIVSRSTASASELLINNLKPYMDVRLIGPNATHGKPVGFFPIEDGEWYVFPVSFKTLNKNNEGSYYSGFSPNAVVADGLDKDWGDVNESGLASALRNINSGFYRGVDEPAYNEAPAVGAGNTILDKPMLKITVDNRK